MATIASENRQAPRSRRPISSSRTVPMSSSRHAVPETPKTASELMKEAKSQAKLMDQLLRVKEPWDRDVENLRNRIRSLHKAIHFSHPTSSSSQSIDYLWIYTTHIIIVQYRALISSLDKKLAQQNQGRRTGGVDVTGPVEIRKILTRFRSFLCSEQTFYRSLITSFVETFNLTQTAEQGETPDVQAYLEVLGIPVSSREEDSLNSSISAAQELSHDESLKKIGLVHKALVCLGDLERYKEQYGSERDKLFGQSGRQGRKGQKGTKESRTEEDETFGKAKKYYEVARGLLPENGNPSNQMAVIATNAGDTFTAVYHYYRALACHQPFITAEQNLNKMLKRSMAEWRLTHSEVQGSDGEGNLRFPDLAQGSALESLKKEEVLLQAILITGDPTPAFENLVADHAAHLGRLLADREIPAEVIVKTIVMIITCHWTIRVREPRDAMDDEDSEGAALWYLFNIAGVMLDVADQEVKDGLGEARVAALDEETAIDESQADADGPISSIDLYPHITAVLRRLLPALRIFSKWLKANASILDEDTFAQQAEFWTTYAAFCRHLEALFPLAHLPELTDPLEEDFDMRGLSPLKRGMMDRSNTSNDPAEVSHTLATRQTSEAHPNEEQLMRISDLLCDGKLVAAQAPPELWNPVHPSSFASRVGVPGPAQRMDSGSYNDRRGTVSAADYLPLISHLPESRDGAPYREESDAASISTATEDDPVNLAMRATMADGMSLVDDDERLSIGEAEDDEDGDEEEVIWPNRNSRMTTQVPALDTSGLATPTFAVQSSFAPPPQSSARAQDLLHSLMTGSPAQKPVNQMPSPSGNNPNGSPYSNAASPMLFGGGGLPSGGSIWTRGINEPDGAFERSQSGSGFARAGSMTTLHGLQGWNSGGESQQTLIPPLRTLNDAQAGPGLNGSASNSSSNRTRSPFA